MSDSPPPKQFQFSLLTAVVLTIVAGAVLGLAVAFYLTVHHAVEAEYTLHATETATRAITQYLTEHPGQWPRSWSDLETVAVPRRGMYEWPRNSAEIRRRVSIDFGVQLEDLAKQTPETFNAIKPIGPYYRMYDSDTEGLLQQIRADIEQRATNAR